MGINQGDLNKFYGYIEKLEDNAKGKGIMGEVAEGTAKEVKSNANFRGHRDSSGKFIKPTGETKNSVRVLDGDVVVGGASEFLEYGTRYMPAQPFVRVSLKNVESILKKSLKSFER